jgi:SAM-dependent methyltransferase
MSRDGALTTAVRRRLVTGERVTTPAGSFNPTWQRHVAAYRLAAPHLPEGRVLDLGCGVGHSFRELAPRETVGVDLDAEALAGQDRQTVVADMRALPLPDRAFASVLSVHSIEHVPDAGRVLAEITRVLEPDGVCVLVTPNRLTFGRPDEIIDPYHFVEYSADELRDLCAPWFEEVEVLGLFGSPRFMELKAEQSARLDRVLGKDPLRLRRFVPLKAKQLAYDALHTRSRRAADPRALAIEPGDFDLRREGLDDALDVVAVARRPRVTGRP